MPDLILKKTGASVFVPPDGLADALASGIYEAPASGQKVAVELRPGTVGETDIDSLPAIQGGGASVEPEASFRGRERKARIGRENSGVVAGGLTVVENFANEATLGATGAIGEAIGGQDYTDDRLERSEARPNLAAIGTVGGVVLPALASGGAGVAGKLARATPLGKVTAIGGKIAKAGEGASTLTKGVRIAAGGAFEGGAQGFGQGVQQLTDSDDPLTWERATSVLSSNTLMGAGIGAGANLAGKAVEKGLSKAKGYLDDAAAKIGSRTDDVAGDLAGMDSKALRSAHDAELGAIESARVPQRAELADEIGKFRAELREQKLYLATKGIKEDGIGALGKRTLNADREIDRLLDNPKMLAEKPHMAKAALQKQEAALEAIVAKRETLIAKYADDTSGVRLAALDAAPAALERNRAIQKRIADIVTPPTSQRLTDIADAKDALVTGVSKKGMPQQLLEGSVFGNVTALAAPLGPLAPMLGAKVSSIVGDLVFGRMGKAAAETAKRTSAAVSSFLDVARKVTPAAPVLATRVLSEVAYAPAKPTKKGDPTPPKSTLASLYKERAAEIRSQVTQGPLGPVMRREAREKVSERLRPIAAMNPILADRIETLAARRLEFLASKLPKRPDLGGIPTGPDRWQPSDMEMRTFARYAAGVEDPGGIEERVADGTVTPEDAEVMSAVYPERKAEHIRQIIEKLGELREQLPYARRLALSIYSGVPVDAACNPQILRTLQASFVQEPGSEGGMQAPRAAPQFGSVKSQDATPSQMRQGAG